MNEQTRDNLIYLAVGLSFAALLALDAFYSDVHGLRMWMPSRFAFRAVYTPSLLAYFVMKEMRLRKATLFQMLAAVLFAILFQLGILFGFRPIVDQLHGLTYSALALAEMFFLWQLSVQIGFYQGGTRRR